MYQLFKHCDCPVFVVPLYWLKQKLKPSQVIFYGIHLLGTLPSFSHAFLVRVQGDLTQATVRRQKTEIKCDKLLYMVAEQTDTNCAKDCKTPLLDFTDWV